MRKTILIVFALSALLVGCGGPKGNYGEPVTIKEATPIEEILRYPAEYEEADVMVEGIIDNLENEGKTVFVIDGHSHALRCEIEGDFALPESVKTRGIRAQGRAVFNREIMQATFTIRGCEIF